MHVSNNKLLASDNRGLIYFITALNFSMKNALFILSKKGALRANHYHQKDTHVTYLITGKFEYFEKKVQSNRFGTVSRIIHPGEMVETLPNTIHAMKFMEDSSMLVLTTEKRDQKSYEGDTVRIQLI